MTTNARFTDLGGGVSSETMANQVQFFYNPTTYAARALFNGQPYLLINNIYRQLGTDNDMLEVDFTNKMLQCYAPPGTLDPVTGVDLSGVSVAGVMTLIKVAYDVEFNARAAAIAAAIASGTTTSTTTTSTTTTTTAAP